MGFPTRNRNLNDDYADPGHYCRTYCGTPLFQLCWGDTDFIRVDEEWQWYLYSRMKKELTNRYFNKHSKTCLCSKCIVNAEYCKRKPHYERCNCYNCKFPKNYVNVQDCKRRKIQ